MPLNVIFICNQYLDNYSYVNHDNMPLNVIFICNRSVNHGNMPLKNNCLLHLIL